MNKKIIINKAFANIDTVHGHCEECEEDSILVAIVTEFYRCTNCGADTRQHINGSITYIPHLTKDTLQSTVDNYLGYGKES